MMRRFFATKSVSTKVPSLKSVKDKIQPKVSSETPIPVASSLSNNKKTSKRRKGAAEADEDDENYRFNPQTAEDFEFRDAYSSPTGYMRARLAYDLLTLPIRSPMRRDFVEDEGNSSKFLPTVPFDEDSYWAAARGRQSPQAFGKLIAIYARRNDFVNALRVLEAADAASMLNVRHCTTLLRVCPTLADAERHVLRRVAQMSKPELDTHFFSALLFVHRRERSVGYEVLGLIEKAGLKPDTVVYTDLIRNAANLNRYEDCWRLFREMRRLDITPDEVVFTQMIHTASKRQETERAIGLYEEMISMDLHPTDVTYDVLIRACASRYDYADEAVLMFERMRAAGFAPSSVTYCAVMMAMSHRNDREALESVYEQAVGENGGKPTVQLDSRLLFSYARQCEVGGRPEASQMFEIASDLLKHYEDSGDGLPDQIVDAYLAFLCSACLIDRARKFFDLHPTTTQRVTTMLQMFAATRRADDAVALAQRALALKALDGDGLTAVLGACSRAYYAKSGTSLWLEAAHTGVLPDADTVGVRKFLALLKRIQRDDDIAKLMPLTSRNPRTVPRTFFPYERGTAGRAHRMNRKLPADRVREQAMADAAAKHAKQ
jgi:pentatricopeptide repeat protein